MGEWIVTGVGVCMDKRTGKWKDGWARWGSGAAGRGWLSKMLKTSMQLGLVVISALSYQVWVRADKSLVH